MTAHPCTPPTSCPLLTNGSYMGSWEIVDLIFFDVICKLTSSSASAGVHRGMSHLWRSCWAFPVSCCEHADTQCFLDKLLTICRNDVVHMQTSRESTCELLISGQYIQCQHCTNLRERLRHKSDRGRRKGSAEAANVSTFTTNVSLSTLDS